ncbi:MAG TPA: nickel pincer cofactor biosynthesis protein LarB [Oscillatoriales cyanobacterium M59_W2019_021]|nr:MAG: nickel pincer cofactor biosynthesis protein LarB [Cyanobacteria bacterium J055]HIK30188.1 nickel pincer cofactor biosynthesis protein LarB [Oscillatoriales cyanobacterium M4454_W2019_049]HIK52331.1 nickel pincer cofactor biosynthesis protein LarB [Oscillatoriales cyanobacterium M59_W2019_021]
MTPHETLHHLLTAVATGRVTPDAAVEKLRHFSFESVGDFAKIDHHRSLRNGFPEVIWGMGKTPEQIWQIMEAMQQKNAELSQSVPIMATRIEPEVFAHLRTRIRDLRYDRVARICAIAPDPLTPKYPGLIAIVTAGTSDIPVAQEAAFTAEIFGFEVKRLWDVGVAGIHRLLGNLDVLGTADVLIVVAGMEGALPSVVGGLVDCPVIAVPTSIGYGAHFGGISPLLTMLNSCAAGIGVVNIDNGFGAAVLACQILRTAGRLGNG